MYARHEKLKELWKLLTVYNFSISPYTGQNVLTFNFGQAYLH